MLALGCASGHTVSSSSSCRENVERRDMLDSEWSDRTEMAESDLRGVPIGGCENRRPWRGEVMAHCICYTEREQYMNVCGTLCTSFITVVYKVDKIKWEE